jgi:hypothetical protein
MANLVSLGEIGADFIEAQPGDRDIKFLSRFN